MTAAKVAQLCTDLLAAGVAFAVGPNPDIQGDLMVTVQPSATVDAKQIAQLEVKYGISSPVANPVVFV